MPGPVSKPHLPFSRLVGAVCNCAVSTQPTAPTGPGANIELPNYFLKPHLDCDLKAQTNSLRYIFQSVGRDSYLNARL